VHGESNRDQRLDRCAHLAQRIRQIVRDQRGAHRAHAAADVDADRSGNDRVARGDHRSHGSALAEMHIRHDRDRPCNDRQRGDVLHLRDRFVLHLHAVRPGADVGQCVEVHDVSPKVILSFRAEGAESQSLEGLRSLASLGMTRAEIWRRIAVSSRSPPVDSRVSIHLRQCAFNISGRGRWTRTSYCCVQSAVPRPLWLVPDRPAKKEGTKRSKHPPRPLPLTPLRERGWLFGVIARYRSGTSAFTARDAGHYTTITTTTVSFRANGEESQACAVLRSLAALRMTRPKKLPCSHRTTRRRTAALQTWPSPARPGCTVRGDFIPGGKAGADRNRSREPA